MENKEDFFKDEAIPLVVYDPEKREFVLNEDVGDFLKQLKGPIGVVAVAGLYRTGKSYLLNRMLLNRSGGFGVGPTINPCTKGLWIWGRPISGFSADGEPIEVLVVDTEGLGALDEDSNHDVRVFSLAILISSFFIYNSVGSIDENALQTLSLVINLTKHIQLKSKGNQEDIDPEEYSQYFPSFMWVVRDFALQLTDTEGETITSKEYLEKALQNQKGFSDGVESKNRIRRLLKTFFKERDCCTMIRPLTKEENLQTLETIDLEDLRAEFVEQVMQLRRKVMNKMRPKMLNGRKLNGEMLYHLIGSYVDAINKGAVPNIETAWSYICKNECLKAQYEAYDKFEKDFQQNFELRAPMFEDELKEVYIDAKKIAVDEFAKVAVGDVQKEFMDQLKDKIKRRYKAIRDENERITEQQIMFFLQSQYQGIERKLKQGEYESLFDLEADVREFQHFFEENGPPGPNRKAILLDFLQKSYSEAAQFFCKNLANELHLQKHISEDTVGKLQAEVKELKDESRERMDNLESKLRAAETEKAELSAKEQSLKENMAQIQSEKRQLETELRERLESEKKDAARLIEEYKNKVYQSEEQSKEMHRQVMATESEYDKQKALLEQKIEFYEKNLEEAQKKEKELAVELKSQKRDHFSVVKEATVKFEQQIKDLNKKCEDQSEKLFEQESSIQELELKYEQEKQKWDEVELATKKDSSKTKDLASELQKQNDILKKKYDEEVGSWKVQCEDQQLLTSGRIQELEQELKESVTNLDSQKQRWDKDAAIFKQKQEFLELQLKESKNKMEEQRQNHEAMLKAVQSKETESSVGKEEASKRVTDLKDQHNKELQEMQFKFDQINQKLSTHVDGLTERNQELELSLKIQIADFEKEVATLRDQLAISEEQKGKAMEANKALDSQKLKLLEESELRYKEQITELERELEERDESNQTAAEDLQAKSEESLTALRNTYEMEKERLERRLMDEKDRAQKRYNQMLEEMETKLKEEQTNHEDDMNMVQDEIAEKDAQMQEVAHHLEHENSLKSQQIESLEKYLAETKDSLSKIQAMSSQSMEAQLDRFNQERGDLISKIENLTASLTRQERTITTLENQKESLSQQVASKEKTVKDMRSESSQQTTDLAEKLDALRAKQQRTLDDQTSSKIDHERDKALKEQQIHFQEQRITELSKNFEDTVRRYDERLRSEREEMQKDHVERLSRLQAEKEASDQKYDIKRRALKELETNMTKNGASQEREKAVLVEKHQNLENQQKELIRNYEGEIEKLNAANAQLNEALSGDKSAIQGELEKWKRDFYELDRQHSDQNNSYDRDKALWEGKFKFLDEQKESLKRENESNARKFTDTIESMRKQQSDGKGKQESQAHQRLQQQEQQFKQQIKELQENQTLLITELHQKTKTLERENKVLADKLEIINKSRSSEHGSMEKKLEKALENERVLQRELDDVKADRDRKFQEHTKMLDKERENYKHKLRDNESKTGRGDAKITEMMLNFEKDRAKWDHEKTFFMNQRDDALENSQRMEKKVEMLLRDNEKLKNDLRNNRKNMYQAAANTSGYQAAMVGSKLIGGLGNISAFKPGGGQGPETARTNLGGAFGKLPVGGLDSKDTSFAAGSYASARHHLDPSSSDKSFTASTGAATSGAVGGLNMAGLENSMSKNILSTPSSNRSGADDKSAEKSSMFSPEGGAAGQK